jgi:hypothetical protein
MFFDNSLADVMKEKYSDNYTCERPPVPQQVHLSFFSSNSPHPSPLLSAYFLLLRNQEVRTVQFLFSSL